MYIGKHKKQIRYVCPKCFSDMKINVKNLPEVKFDQLSDMETDLSPASEISTDIDIYFEVSGKCNICKYEGEFIDIDENMYEICKILNKKGYTTRNCCEGHNVYSPDGIVVGYGMPYLEFITDIDDVSYFNKILPLVPESWEIFRNNKWNFSEEEKENYSVRSHLITMYCRSTVLYKDWLQDLKDFVNNIPEIYNPLFKREKELKDRGELYGQNN